MARRAAKNTPIIIQGVVYHNTGSVQLGSEEWYTYVQSQARIIYIREQRLPDSTIISGVTLRKEQVRNTLYWYAYYRDDNGKLHKRYVGKPERMTLERIQAVCKAIIDVV